MFSPLPRAAPFHSYLSVLWKIKAQTKKKVMVDTVITKSKVTFLLLRSESVEEFVIRGIFLFLLVQSLIYLSGA